MNKNLQQFSYGQYVCIYCVAVMCCLYSVIAVYKSSIPRPMNKVPPPPGTTYVRTPIKQKPAAVKSQSSLGMFVIISFLQLTIATQLDLGCNITV